jgi:hypothetical protein
VFIKGRLDRVAGESLRVARDAMGQRGDDTRSPGQASADALVMLAERACAGSSSTNGEGAGGEQSAGRAAGSAGADRAGTASPGSVSRPHVSLLVPAETIAELLVHQRAGADIECAPIALPWGTVAPATLEDGTPVAMSALATALCEADVTRMVMSAESLPLDVGRSRRLFTTAQRRAAIARDQQCTWNGCEQRASRCEVHHVRWWDRDTGPTSITNAALLCKHHHSEVHRLDLSIQRLEKPPGWTRRQRAAADGPAGGRQPMRYVFRDRRGRIVSSPDEHPPDR